MIPTSDLISGFDESDLSKLIDDCDADTARKIRSILGPAAAAQLDSRGLEAGGLFGFNPDPVPFNPNLPELVLLHGITDCHLANTEGRRNRIWLDFVELVKGRFTRELPLLPDGISDQHGVKLEPDGHVGTKYDRALAAWTAAGFRNQVFCYDWRRSVTSAADHLKVTLQNSSSVKNGEKVLLVCHSMGGLVAATFAARHPEWSEMVSHCIFVGSPLGGSYSVPVTILGHAPSFQKMDRLSVFESLEDFQRMAASFPGLLDMLPHPDLFPDAADLYKTSGWPGVVRPQGSLLQSSRELKDVIWSSPIFSRSTHLISQGHETVSKMPWNDDRSDRLPNVTSTEGDGAALNLSSLAPGLRAFLVSGEHGMLLNSTEVFSAVMKIARGEEPGLTAIESNQLSGDVKIASAMMAPAGLVVPSRDEEVDTRIGEELALHFASEAAVTAQLRAIAEPGFDRIGLRDRGFSWKNALSLAIASDLAYRSDQVEAASNALGEWGFKAYKHFEADETQGFVCWDDEAGPVVLPRHGEED